MSRSAVKRIAEMANNESRKQSGQEMVAQQTYRDVNEVLQETGSMRKVVLLLVLSAALYSQNPPVLPTRTATPTTI